ncbi:inosamine-phosphate amidinotransferase 1 [Streptomyces sp. Go40/10]|uniref:inosamine-phosphate amidinotransferase 1 n=1 Tax=Streptomyces sp. Go40/10 TaxID=2825844 RepID=UPI001E44E5A2|nr:inosamine-phosphate amidinotransferase 1 [Streptomyces sp. Go40/10]UFQ99803.1 inosamine-phosphate amidinotransferase 1 [Streptomyces sp. Go40/10]
MTKPQSQLDPPAQGVHSFDDFSRLREVVVGRADHYNEHDADSSWRLFYYENVAPHLPEGQRRLSVPQQIVDELIEDVTGFANALAGCGVRVLRPSAPGKDVQVSSPWWSSGATPPLNVRDNAVILGTTIVETAPHIRGRVFENDHIKPHFNRYFEQGSNWLSMPRPALAAHSLDTAYFDRNDIDVTAAMAGEDALPIDGLGLEMVFDGAQCVRLGRDVLVNVANHNHELAYRWLSHNFPELRWHRLPGIADNHVDSIVVPLRPGLMLLREPKYLELLPEAMRGWEVIYPPPSSVPEPDYDEFGFVIPTASRYIDINVLSIDENTVVVNSLYPELIEVLEQRHFTVVPVQHRHRRLFGGGHHCFTLDTVRDGGSEDYLTA